MDARRLELGGGEGGAIVIEPVALGVAESVLRSLNHELRQRILGLLDEHGELTVTQIYWKLRLSQSITSQHLTKLRRAGFVGTRRDGKNIYYRLDRERLRQVADLIGALGA